jgi:hypothetical protein
MLTRANRGACCTRTLGVFLFWGHRMLLGGWYNGGREERKVTWQCAATNKLLQTCQTIFADMPSMPESLKIIKMSVLSDYLTDIHDFGTVRTAFIIRIRILTRIMTDLLITHIFHMF